MCHYIYIYIHTHTHTRWFKYDRDCLHLFTHKSVPVIFEPPCVCMYVCMYMCVCVYIYIYVMWLYAQKYLVAKFLTQKRSSPYTTLSYTRHINTQYRVLFLLEQKLQYQTFLLFNCTHWHISQFYLTIFQHHIFIFIAAIFYF